MIGRSDQRRGEVPFVAIRVGRSNDPREVLGLARELKIPRAHALGFVALWEEFLLEIGDALTGRVKGYSADHIAAKLGWEGSPTKLVDALEHAGLLNKQKTTFFHPYWSSSITGQYAIDRAEQREYWRLKKRAQRAGDAGDVPGESPGHRGDVPGTSQGTADIKKERNGGIRGSAPPAPPGTGGELGATRWDWIQKNHKRPRDSRRCIPLLGALDDANWAMCQWVVTEAKPGGALSRSRKKRALALDSYRFLQNEAYLEFHAERVAKVAELERLSKNGSTVEPVQDKVAASISFVLERLSDPDVSAEKKEKLRRSWMDANPGETPPWEAPGPARGGENAQA